MSSYPFFLVYPCGYSRDGALVHHLMKRDPRMLLIDTRMSPRSHWSEWNQSSLHTRYSKRYRWAGAFLGNRNYATGGPITLADPAVGIAGLLQYLQEGHLLILLCGCYDFTLCHVSLIVSLLQQARPTVLAVLPEDVRYIAALTTHHCSQPEQEEHRA
ncbi:hypothetical protein [Reticulibacter mediterranei]|nr:hypothetical protein [Reticulibacter mediterranei]